MVRIAGDPSILILDCLTPFGVKCRASVRAGMVVVIQRVGWVMVSYGERPGDRGAPQLLLLLHFTLSPTLFLFLMVELYNWYLLPDLLLLPASWRFHARPTHPREIGWPGVRVYPLRLGWVGLWSAGWRMKLITCCLGAISIVLLSSH